MKSKCLYLMVVCIVFIMQTCSMDIQIKQEHNKDTSTMVLAAMDSEADQEIGYAKYTCMKKNNTAYIHELYVHPAYRNKGYGKHIMDAVLNNIQNHKSEKVLLCAMPLLKNVSLRSLFDYIKTYQLYATANAFCVGLEIYAGYQICCKNKNALRKIAWAFCFLAPFFVEKFSNSLPCYYKKIGFEKTGFFSQWMVYSIKKKQSCTHKEVLRVTELSL